MKDPGFVMMISRLREILSGPVFTYPLEDLNTEDKSLLYALLTHLERVIRKRKNALKPPLTEITHAEGVPKGKGFELPYASGIKSRVTVRRDKLPPEKKLRALLIERGIELDEAFTVKTSFEVSPDKLDKLVSTGRLSAEEVESLKGSSLSLRVNVPKRQKEVIAKGLEGIEPPDGDIPLF